MISVLEVMKPYEFQNLPYRMYVPEETPRTLILFLHGAGERGTDNQKQIAYNNQFLHRYINSAYAKTHPAIVLAPQCPERREDGTEEKWVYKPWGEGTFYGLKEESFPLKTVVELCKEVIEKYHLDASHSIVTGISMGGFGTWDLISRHPGMFYKAVPICGGGSTKREDVERIVESGVQIWTFHGNADDIVPVSGTRNMVEAIRKVGGEVKYTEYDGIMHGSWEPAYDEKTLLSWLFDF